MFIQLYPPLLVQYVIKWLLLNKDPVSSQYLCANATRKNAELDTLALKRVLLSAFICVLQFSGSRLVQKHSVLYLILSPEEYYRPPA